MKTNHVYAKLFVLIMSMLAPVVATACDICGLYMGILPYEQSSSISLVHRYRVFNGYKEVGQSPFLFPANASFFGRGLFQASASGTGHSHASGTVHTLSPLDFEVYRMAELRLRWFVHRRIEFTAIVPWVMNDTRIDAANSHVSGLGDVAILAGYHVIEPTAGLNWRHRLIIGCGLKLPTGNYYAAGSNGQRLDLLLQPGTGMVEGLLFVTYQIAKRNWLATANAQAKFSGWNFYQESFAPGWTATLSVGRQLRTNGWKFIPQIQLYGEKTQGLRFSTETLQQHQMSAVLGGIGLDVFWHQLQLTSAVQLPVAQTTFGHLQQAGRITLALTYHLKSSLRLLGS